MDQGTRLQVALEDVGGRSWWAGALTTLAGQSGSATMRFVALVDGAPRYAGPTFVVPRGLGASPPQPPWAPDLERSLRALREDVERDGWVLEDRGEQPWQLSYRRVG